jgi:hypothetical protein
LALENSAGNINEEKNNISTTLIGLEKAIIFGLFSRINRRIYRFDCSAIPALALKIQRLAPMSGNDIFWKPEENISDDDVNGLDQILISSAQIFGYSQRRELVTLDIVKTSPKASILSLSVTPGILGNEFTDLICGECGQTICQGVSVDTLRGKFSVSEQLILRCKCGADNFVPVRGTQRNRATR